MRGNVRLALRRLSLRRSNLREPRHNRDEDDWTIDDGAIAVHPIGEAHEAVSPAGDIQVRNIFPPTRSYVFTVLVGLSVIMCIISAVLKRGVDYLAPS